MPFCSMATIKTAEPMVLPPIARDGAGHAATAADTRHCVRSRTTPGAANQNCYAHHVNRGVGLKFCRSLQATKAIARQAAAMRRHLSQRATNVYQHKGKNAQVLQRGRLTLKCQLVHLEPRGKPRRRCLCSSALRVYKRTYRTRQPICVNKSGSPTPWTGVGLSVVTGRVALRLLAVALSRDPVPVVPRTRGQVSVLCGKRTAVQNASDRTICRPQLSDCFAR